MRARAILTSSSSSEELEPPAVHVLDGESNTILPQTPTRARILPPPQILITPASDTSSEINFGTFSAPDSESEANSTSTIADQFQSRQDDERFVDDITQRVIYGVRKVSEPIYKTPKVTAGTKRASPTDVELEKVVKRIVSGVKVEVSGSVKRHEETIADDIATRIVREMRKASEEDPKFMKDLVNLRQSKKTEVVTDSSADSPHVVKRKKSVSFGYRPTIPYHFTTNPKAKNDDRGVELVKRETEGDTDVTQTPPPSKKISSLRNRASRADTDTDTDSSRSNRPHTTDFVARRMISHHLGVKVEPRKDEKTVAVRTALRMDKKTDRISSWENFLSKKDMEIYERQG